MRRGATLPTSFRTSVRYYRHETLPETNGWPFFKTTLTVDGISVATAIRLPFFRKLFPFALTAQWAELAKVERTRQGIRLIFKDNRKPVVVATPTRHKQLVRVVQSACPIEFDPTLRPGSWTSI